MTAKVAKVGSKEWTVVITQGVQSFHLEYRSTKTDADWMARMFRKAIAASKEEA